MSTELAQDEITILKRTALEIGRGELVNLGIGMPTMLPSFLPDGLDVSFHSENGFIGMGPPVEGGTPDHDIIDAGGRACTIQQGGAFFDSVMSFAIVRGGKLDVAVLGAFEVAVNGDLANWKIPGKLTPGMGGGMELAQKANHVIVMSRHTTKKGAGKLVAKCTLPLTARACVHTLITEKAVFSLRRGRLALVSIAPGETREGVLNPIDADVPIAEELLDWNTPVRSNEG